MNKYLKEYQWSNILAMSRNNKARPKECGDDFKGRLVLITGATSGIGYCTAKEYASHGANLLCVNRNEEKSAALCEEIRQEFGVACDYKIADFSRISEVRRAAREILASDMNIDILIHNAGVYSTKKILTEDDNELVFQVIYLGSFILTYILRDKLKAQDKARILFVNSEGHRFAVLGIRLDDLNWQNHHYTGLKGYGAAKTAQMLSMIKFDEYFRDSGVTVNAMHPGNVLTNMGENNGRLYLFWKHNVINRSADSPEISSKALYYLGVSKDIDGVSGKFFNLTNEEEPAPPALDREVAEELWNASIKLGHLE